MRRALLALALIVTAAPAGAEKLVSTVSNPNVLITSSFDGASLSLFGNIEADGSAPGPYNVIVIVTGPLQDRVTRIKTNNLGIWSNTDHVNFHHFPSFYAVVASGKLELIAEPELLAAQAVRAEDQARAASQSTGLKSERFSGELVRLMSEENHFVLREDGVNFLSPTAYSVNIALPSDVANGPFLVHTLVLRNKQLVAERSEGFSVRKAGFENFVFVASRQQPLLYGLICVVLAIGTGWLAGVAFRR
ncbi:MAG: TIGR02186 family protein [Devosia sp.]